jgi:hypothetical protein
VEASEDPALADNALIALAGMPGSFAQEHLKVVALSPHKPLDIREEASLHLAYHIQRFGLLLSRQDVADIKREWKAAKNPALATALAAIVGSLKPSARRVSDRMQVFPAPALPPSE